MKAGWESKKLGEIADYFIGLTYSPKDVSTEGMIVLRSSNVQNGVIDLSDIVRVNKSIQEKLIVKDGDILMCSRNGSARLVGKTATIQASAEPMTFGTFMTVIRSQFNPYLSYFFQSELFRQQISGGENTMINQITKYMLNDVIVPFTSIAEQAKLVSILDDAFEGISIAKANAEKNLKNARELFERHLQTVFTQSGDGWVARRLGDVFEIGSSKRIMEKDWVSTGVPFYGGKEIVKLAKFGSVISNAYISEEKYQDYASKYDMPRQNDILITARGTIGVGYVVKEADKFYYKDGNIISMRAKGGANPYFILYAFKSNVMLEQLGELTGTTVRHLPIEKAKELNLRMPEFESQNSVVEKIRKVEEETQRLESIYQQKIKALAELKKSLLHKAFSGEL